MIIIGHRGAAGHLPENTLPSFQKALDFGVPMIELDVYSVEGKLMVIHDDRVDRTTDGEGYVSDLSVDELRKLDAGDSAKIPFLEEVLDLIDRKCAVNVELKGENTAEPVAQMIAEYVGEKNWKHDDFLVSSFNHPELALFQKHNADVPVGALIEAIPIDYARFAADLGAKFLNCSVDFVNQKFVDDAHARGLEVLVYTVNHPDDFARMKALGVDGVFSNYPDRGNDL